MKRIFLLVAVLLLGACSQSHVDAGGTSAAYFDNAGRDDVLSGGVKMIPVATTRGTFHVWTKRVGNNPRIKVLLLHGGPRATHEYFEAFDSFSRQPDSNTTTTTSWGRRSATSRTMRNAGTCPGSWTKWSRYGLPSI